MSSTKAGPTTTAESPRRSVRRNLVDERRAALIGAISGLLAATSTVLADVRPTGQPAVDAVLVGVCVGVVTWLAASSPWWAVAAAAGVAAAVALHPVLIVLAVVAFAGALWIGIRRSDLPELRAAIAGVALNVLLLAELQVFFGASAVVGIAVALLLLISGLLRRPRRVRRPTLVALGVVGGLAVVASGLFAASVWSTRQALVDGNDAARSGMNLLRTGDSDGAREAFERAGDAFGRVDRLVGAGWVQPARLVPVVAQHRDALADLAHTASGASTSIADELGSFDLDDVRIVDGRIDVDAVRALQSPLDGLRVAIDDIEATARDISSPWLVEPVTRRVDDLLVDVAEQQRTSDNAKAALAVAPAMLGADGPRTYLVAFATPVEARGHGGFLGNYAELIVDDGAITLSVFGRTRDLNRGGERPRTVTGPREWLDRYGRFGFTNASGGTVGSVPWSNVTMSPHFPSTAAVMAELYPQSGGSLVDGVFALDVETVVALLEFTGPVTVEGLAGPLTVGNALDFLLVDQYLNDSNEDRIDTLEDVALTVVEELLAGALPGPVALGRSLGPMVGEGRLTGYAVRPDEQALFERLLMAGALPDAGGGDGIALALNNGGGNKIDNFLDAELVYDVTPDPVTGAVTGTVTVTLVNSAPAGGLPRYLIGNSFGLPVGTSRLWLTAYTQLDVVGATLDGEAFPLEVTQEQGYVAAAEFVTIPPGGTSTLTVEVSGVLGGPFDPYRLVVRTPAAVRPVAATVNVFAPDRSVTTTVIDRPGVTRIVVVSE